MNFINRIKPVHLLHPSINPTHPSINELFSYLNLLNIIEQISSLIIHSNHDFQQSFLQRFIVNDKETREQLRKARGHWIFVHISPFERSRQKIINILVVDELLI